MSFWALSSNVIDIYVGDTLVTRSKDYYHDVYYDGGTSSSGTTGTMWLERVRVEDPVSTSSSHYGVFATDFALLHISSW